MIPSVKISLQKLTLVSLLVLLCIALWAAVPTIRTISANSAKWSAGS